MYVHQHISDTICCLAGAGTEAFCSGGDQSVRGKGGYVGADGVPRLNVLDLQVGSLAYMNVSHVDHATQCWVWSWTVHV